MNPIRQHCFSSAWRHAQGVVTTLVIGVFLMTMAVPDIDHHFSYSAGQQTAGFVCDTHSKAGTQKEADEKNHHCLACPSSSQKISSSTSHVFVNSLLVFSIVSIRSTDHHAQLVDLHYSGKRSPPQE